MQSRFIVKGVGTNEAFSSFCTCHRHCGLRGLADLTGDVPDAAGNIAHSHADIARRRDPLQTEPTTLLGTIDRTNGGYRWFNSHWWYWTPQNRWMVYCDQSGWVFPEAIPRYTTRYGSAALAPKPSCPASRATLGREDPITPDLALLDTLRAI